MLSAAIGFSALAWCPPALALNAALDVSQYAHTAWKVRDGFAKGRVDAIAQTPDGYLWLGTEAGLLRFDGVRNVPWQPPGGQRLPSDVVVSLLAAHDGTLWIGTDRGLASWKEGQLLRHEALAGSYLGRLYEDREGSIWITRFTNRWTLCSIQKGRVTCFGEDGGPGAGAIGLYEDRKGSLWVGTVGTPTGIWRWRPGPPTFYPLYPLPMAPNGIQGISEDEDGSLLIANAGGVRRLIDGQAVMKYPFPPSTEAAILLRDRDGGVWVGTSTRGLLHVHDGITDVFSQADGLSSDDVLAVVEDREGTIWVATAGGLDRFRESAVVQYSVNEGLSTDEVLSVLASHDGSVWLGTNDGLNRWTRGEVTVYREDRALRASSKLNDRHVREITGVGMPVGPVQSVFEDSQGRVWLSTLRGVGYLENDRFVSVSALPGGLTRAIVEDRHKDLWIANLNVGLLRLIRGSHEVEQIAWTALKHNDPVMVLAADPSDEGLWFGFLQGGVAHFVGRQVRASYAASDGLAGGRVSALYADSTGALWISAIGGLSRLKNGRVATLTSRNGLPCDAVGWVVEDTAHSLWLGMACGLVRIARTAIDVWTSAVDNGDKNAEVAQRVDAKVFDQADGARILINQGYYNAPVARTPDGKLWFAAQGGVSVIDPRHIPFNNQPPPVHVEQVIADHTPHDALRGTGPLRLPALIRDLEIDYTALSLVAPEKNRFRIRLEGWDRDWQDVGTRRQAFYNNLPPRSYRFRVIASNNSGVWNETGASLDFSIAPAYYQTTWFRAASVIGVLALLWAAYQYRVRQVAAAFDARLQERVNERTRIARELHDTLLQSFHGLLFRFQAATNKLPDSQVKQDFERAIDHAAQAITEGRDAVQNLRGSTVVTNDLAEALSTLGDELAGGHNSEPDRRTPIVDIAVEGTPRDLHPILRDDIYRIAGEALRNAFRHAGARRIEVRIHYDDRQLRVGVRDDGRGIDRTRLEEDRPGHFGLRGMRERAGVIGGSLEVWSEVRLGTEVELRVPAAAVYAAPRARGRFRFFARRTGTNS
jgi:signal transduction histidine kinase/ligand-binding sensor domain-containing protein